jgi:hypothetical protein
MKIKLALALAAAVIGFSGAAFAQGKLDSYMPGDMMGVEMSPSVFEAFFADKEGLVARPSKEFMAMYEKMSPEDRATVRVACSIGEAARAGFSDRISAACRAAGL